MMIYRVEQSMRQGLSSTPFLILVQTSDDPLYLFQMVNIGYGSEYFYVDSNGNVRVRDAAGLRDDVGIIYTVVVTAHDSAFPNMKATSTVTINVNRNPSPPVWDKNSYTFTINDRYLSSFY